MDTNAKTSSFQLTPLTRATTPPTILTQRLKHVHHKAQLLVLLEQLREVIILCMDLLSEFRNLTLISLWTQLQLPDPYFQLTSLLILGWQRLKSGDIRLLLEEDLLQSFVFFSCSNLSNSDSISWSFNLFSSLRSMDKLRFSFLSAFNSSLDHQSIYLDAMSMNSLTSDWWRVSSTVQLKNEVVMDQHFHAEWKTRHRTVAALHHPIASSAQTVE